MSEQILPWPHCALYEVSSEGRIRRIGRDWRSVHYPARHYGMVTLRVNGQRKAFPIHRIIAMTFLGPPPSPRHQVAHCDGDKHNNRASNLRWATAAENLADRRVHGTMTEGERHGHARLTSEQVSEIRQQAASGILHRVIASRFGISRTHVGAIVSGRKWRHLEAQP